MRGHNNRPTSNSPSKYRQSMNILSAQLIRNSFQGNCQTPNPYRESVGSCYRPRTSLNIEMAEHLLRGMEYQKRERERDQMSNLKTTLNDLQKKINKAKRNLNTFTNIISEQSDDQIEGKQFKIQKINFKNEETTTMHSSIGRLALTQNQLDLAQFQKIKGYYLNHLAGAFEGVDKRAWDHLNISLKVLRNYYKIQSPTFADLQQKKVNLSRDKTDMGKKTLIMDIDETILHCEQDPSKPYDIVLPIEIENGSIAKAYITIRPYAISFLKRMAKHYQIIAFTASHQSYADVVLDEIDPERQFIKHRLYRRNCIQIHENIYTKDLRIVNRQLSNIVLIDNAPYSYIFQLENGIPILPYYTGDDNELVQLEKYLQEMLKCQDVREFNKQKFQLHKYCNYSELEELAKGLYVKERKGM